MVPNNATSIVQSDVSQAQANGGVFGSTPIPYVTNSMTADATYLSYRYFSSSPDKCGEQCLTDTHQHPYSFGNWLVFVLGIRQVQQYVAVIRAPNLCRTCSLHIPSSHLYSNVFIHLKYVLRYLIHVIHVDESAVNWNGLNLS